MNGLKLAGSWDRRTLAGNSGGNELFSSGQFGIRRKGGAGKARLFKENGRYQ